MFRLSLYPWAQAGRHGPSEGWYVRKPPSPERNVVLRDSLNRLHTESERGKDFGFLSTSLFPALWFRAFIIIL